MLISLVQCDGCRTVEPMTSAQLEQHQPDILVTPMRWSTDFDPYGKDRHYCSRQCEDKAFGSDLAGEP
jgi:hypothetical protein